MTLDARAAVSEARVGTLVTADAAGKVSAVPFCFVLEGDRLYTAIDAKPKTTRSLRRLANVRANPTVTVLVDHYEEDWTGLWWVRLQGHGRVVPPGAEADRALQLLAAKYVQYRETPPPGPVLAIEVEEWRTWSASG